MKRLTYLIFLTLVLVSCGSRSGHFKLSGHLLNLNQGEFYVYSLDGGIQGIDTIKVQGGRFTYDIACERPSILMLVFPNFSEQPIFATAGEAIEINGDASHLKEMKVEGTDDNELMTDFRELILHASPPEETRLAGQFIEKHPASPVALYLVRKYFILSERPDYRRALSLLDLLAKEQEKNGLLVRMRQQVVSMLSTRQGMPLPSFSATDVKGNRISKAMLGKGIALINVWTSWSFESIETQRQLRQLQQGTGNKLTLLSISLDASKNECLQTIKQDSIKWPTICDERMFDGSLVKTLNISTLPDNILLKNGKIIARGLSQEALLHKLDELLK